MAWQVKLYAHGAPPVAGSTVRDSVREVHVFPLADSRPHTIPMCWCNPKRPNGKGSNLYSHNALSVPD